MQKNKLSVLFFIVTLLLCTCKSSEQNNNANGNNGGDNEPTPTAEGAIIDHTCTEVSSIPDQWISNAKDQLRIHYAHTSHGEQIVAGLQRLSNGDANLDYHQFSASNRYRFYHAYCEVPGGADGLRMMDGQPSSYCETYVTPDLYWEEDHGLEMTRNILHSYDINVSIWAWCSQLDYYSEAEVTHYLETITQLESEFPNVTFVYMTGNAQSEELNRFQRNNQIRDYCRNNQKFLFDFADLDCWYNGQQHTVDGIPMEHPHYHGDQAGHTTYSSCDTKAKAFWWLVARIAGWDGTH